MSTSLIVLLAGMAVLVGLFLYLLKLRRDERKENIDAIVSVVEAEHGKPFGIETRKMLEKLWPK